MNRVINSLLVFLVLQEVFVPYWTGIKVFNVFVLVVLFVTVILRRIPFRYPRLLGITFTAYLGLTLIQGVIWGWSAVSAFNSYLLIFFQTYLIFLLFPRDFFVRVERMFIPLIILALLIWIGINASSSLKDLFYSLASLIGGPSSDIFDRSIFIFTHWFQIDDDFLGLSRFSGFFHEPGACAFFTTFLFGLRYARLGKLDKVHLLYTVVVFTTFSSAGYASLSILIAGVVMNMRVVILRYIIVIPVLIGMVYGYSQITFLQEKLEEQFSSQTEMELDEHTIGRIIGIRKAFYVLGKYPLHGRGLLTITQPESITHPEFVKYGWTSFMSRIGVIAGMAYLLYFIRGYIRELSKYRRLSLWFLVLATISLFINLTSQAFIESIPMLIIFYYGLIKNNKYGR